MRDALCERLGDGTLLFDCALCNLYPEGGDAACKYHSDPEHGTHDQPARARGYYPSLSRARARARVKKEEKK